MEKALAANRTSNGESVAKNPPGGYGDHDQTASQGPNQIGAWHYTAEQGPAMACAAASLCKAATGRKGWHCATTSRAQLSQHPHWVATPSSNWISSKLMPARAWRAISRSDIRRQTQTII